MYESDQRRSYFLKNGKDIEKKKLELRAEI